MLNMSYPPLLYQRGDDSDNDDLREGEEEELDADLYEEDESHQFRNDDVYNVDNMSHLGRELREVEDQDQNNADLKNDEQVINDLFDGRDASGSPELDAVDMTGLEQMIQKSSDNSSPGIEQFNDNLGLLDDFNDQILPQNDQDNLNLNDTENEVIGNLNFYNNLNNFADQDMDGEMEDMMDEDDIALAMGGGLEGMVGEDDGMDMNGLEGFVQNIVNGGEYDENGEEEYEDDNFDELEANQMMQGYNMR